jgi:hypothetical protein
MENGRVSYLVPSLAQFGQEEQSGEWFSGVRSLASENPDFSTARLRFPSLIAKDHRSDSLFEEKILRQRNIQNGRQISRVPEIRRSVHLLWCNFHDAVSIKPA